MSLDRKIMDHFISTPVETMGEVMKYGGRMSEELGMGETPGKIVGMFAGAVLGGARILNPVDAIMTLARTDEEMDKRSSSVMDELGR